MRQDLAFCLHLCSSRSNIWGQGKFSEGRPQTQKSLHWTRLRRGLCWKKWMTIVSYLRWGIADILTKQINDFRPRKQTKNIEYWPYLPPDDICGWPEHGFWDEETHSHPQLSVQAVSGVPDAHPQPLQPILRPVHQTKRVQKTDDVRQRALLSTAPLLRNDGNYSDTQVSI